MTEITDALFDEALGLSASVSDNFMELGRALAQLYNLDRDRFRHLAARSNVGSKGAHQLIEFSRTFEALAIPRDQLHKIVWPKLQLIAKHLTPSTLDALLPLAEQSTVNDLEHRLRGWKKPAGNAHCVLMYFSPKSYEELEKPSCLPTRRRARLPSSRAGRRYRDRSRPWGSSESEK